MTFSEREGLVPKKAIQVDSMDKELRAGFINAFLKFVMCDNHILIKNTPEDSYWIPKEPLWELFSELQKRFFKGRIDRMLDIKRALSDACSPYENYLLNEFLTDAEWYKVYDFIEFIMANWQWGDDKLSAFIEQCDQALKEESAAYRIINKKFVPITSEIEVEEIEKALAIPDAYKNVRGHLDKAFERLADRRGSDYSIAIGESINAVESLVKMLAGKEKGTLPDALKLIEKDERIELHPQLIKSIKSLYNYLSDTHARHGAGPGERDFTDADVRFHLVTCFALVNYLIALKEGAP